MEKLDPKKDGRSPDLVEENIEELRRLFPEAFTEGKVDFDVLRQLLGDHVEDGIERYGLNWAGKARARRIAQTPSSGTLRPVPEESVDWDTTQNIFIEGDNLEVLKLLQKSYHRKVKMIYIDPPYNTGKEFIYPDRYQDNLDTYLRYTGQVDGEGLKLTANAETQGRYHTNWLNMMYPRLKLARNLLRDDGVIFVSIDDHEDHNLRHLLDEVFGPENFEGHIHWRRRHNQPNDRTKMLGLVAEHVLVYARDSVRLKAAGVGKIGLTGSFSNPDDDPRGAWASKPWKVGSNQSGSRYKIVGPRGEIYDEDWMGEKSTFDELLDDGRIAWPSKPGGLPRKKYYESEREAEGQCATNWWSHDRFGHNQGGSAWLAELLGETGVFDNPKPIELLIGMLQVGKVLDHDIVLDFFSGSGSMGDAVMQLNAMDGGRRRYVLVQLPERLDPSRKEHKEAVRFCARAGLRSVISEVTKVRLRRAAESVGLSKVSEDVARAQEGSRLDLGFRVFSLDSSNVRPWQVEVESLDGELLAIVDNLKNGRVESDILFELLLKYGLDLSVPIEERAIDDKRIFVVGAGALVVCLAPGVTLEVVEKIGALKAELQPVTMRVVFRDACFDNDVVKANAVQILKRAGIADIKSL